MVTPLVRFHARALATLLATALAAAGAPAQTACPLALSATQVPVEQLTIADFDVRHFEARGLLFTVTIANSSASPADARLLIDLAIDLADGSSYPGAAVMRTESFTVPPGGRTVTNLDLGQSRAIPFASFDIDPGARDAVEDRTLSSGLLPAGVYTFRFRLEDCATAPPVDVVIRIGNASRVELISPRNGEEVSTFPLLEFYHEGRAARLTVAELADGRTPEDAIDRDPPMLRVDLGAERSYLYTGGRPLQRGRTYAWRVQTLTRVAGGTTVDQSSPVGTFTVGREGDEFDALLARLEAMYGSHYPDLFRAIRDGGFRPTGRYLVDGSAIGLPELMSLLDVLQAAVDESELTLE